MSNGRSRMLSSEGECVLQRKTDIPMAIKEEVLIESRPFTMDDSQESLNYHDISDEEEPSTDLPLRIKQEMIYSESGQPYIMEEAYSVNGIKVEYDEPLQTSSPCPSTSKSEDAHYLEAFGVDMEQLKSLHAVELKNDKEKVNPGAKKRVRKQPTKKNYACTFCGYRTAWKSDLIRHVRTHTGEKPFACRECDFRTSTNTSLQQHSRIHTGEKPFICKICGYRAIQKCNLLQHVLTHTGEKPFACNVCTYRTARKGDLKKHKQSHSAEKPFACTLCDHRTAWKSHLLRHIKRHAGKRIYACGDCDYRTLWKINLLQHVQTHTGKKPFGCGACDYRTLRKNNLLRHAQRHSGEKPFCCNLCDYRTARKSCLQEHLRRHETTELFDPAAWDNLLAVHETEKESGLHSVTHLPSDKITYVSNTEQDGKTLYTCNDCGYTMETKKSLTRHIKTHWGEKKAV